MTPTQLPLHIRLRDSSVFASYYAGSNRASVDALAALRVNVPPTCIWLQGPRGTGKTHLLQAACVMASERGESGAYLPLRELRELPSGAELLAGYGQLDLVAIDDAELIAGQADWERALFRLHQELDEHGGHLLVSGSALATTLGFKLRDLASRLAGGQLLSLHALEEEEQREALKLRAQLRGFELPDETVQLLQRRLPRDMASLCAFLDELDQASLIAQRRLTVPFVREVLENRLKS
jgi:DnaA family protein